MRPIAGDRHAKLLDRPLRCWMLGHVPVDDLWPGGAGRADPTRSLPLAGTAPVNVGYRHRLESELEALRAPLPPMGDNHPRAAFDHRTGAYYIGLALGLRVAQLLAVNDGGLR